MEQNIDPKQEITLKLGHTVAKAVISKVILLLVFGSLVGYFMSKDAVRKIEKADKISIEVCSQEVCIDEVLMYKKMLSAYSEEHANLTFAIPMGTLSMLIMFGFYELLAILIGLVVRKIIK